MTGLTDLWDAARNVLQNMMQWLARKFGGEPKTFMNVLSFILFALTLGVITQIDEVGTGMYVAFGLALLSAGVYNGIPSGSTMRRAVTKGAISRIMFTVLLLATLIKTQGWSTVLNTQILGIVTGILLADAVSNVIGTWLSDDGVSKL